MKQICKRLSAIFLTLTIISGSVLTTGIVVNADTYQEIFKEDFNGYKATDGDDNIQPMIDKGWTVPDSKNGTIPYMSRGQANRNTGKAYKVPENNGSNLCLGNLKEAKDWTDYSVQATMTFLASDTATGTTRAGISGRQKEVANNKGYDLLVIKNKVTDKGATIQLRCDGDEVGKATIAELKNDVSFTLRLEFRGTMLYGYLNNKLVVSKETANDVVKYESGWAGIRKPDKPGMGVLYDDFIVSKIEPGPYPYPDGYLYYTNFEEDAVEEALTGNKDPFKAIGFTSTSGNSIVEGDEEGEREVQLAAGGRAYLTKVVGSLEWEDYTVEAKVQIIKNENDTAKKGNAGIIARSSNENKDGYEFSMNYSSNQTNSTREVKFTKRKGTTTDALGTTPVPYEFEFNQYYTLRMTVHGNNITCWINDECVFDVEDKDAVTYATGYAGFRSTGQATYLNGKIDDFSVKEYEPPTYPYCNDFEEPVMRLKTQGWFKDGSKKVLNDGTEENRVYVLDGKGSNYLTGVKDSNTWTNYVVEADVGFDDDDKNYPQYAGIIGRATSTDKKTGYELGLYRKKDAATQEEVTTLRLYKRSVYQGCINGQQNTQEVTLEPGKMANLKMVFRGTDIYCYYNEEIVFEVTDNDTEQEVGVINGNNVNLKLPQYLNGYAGVISATGDVKSFYDNFIVRDIEPNDCPADVVYQPGYLYDNDFETNVRLKREGWQSDGTKTNGTYVLEGGASNYLTGVKESNTWTDYVVEADVGFDDDENYPKYAGIIGRASSTDKKTGYELRLYREKNAVTQEEVTTLRLYKRNVSSGRINGKTNQKEVTLESGKSANLKMVFNGTDIYCYYNGEIVFEVTDNDTETKVGEENGKPVNVALPQYLNGYAGVISASGKAKSFYDNFVVRYIQPDNDFPKDAPYPNDSYLYYNDFSALRALNKEGWRSTGDKINGAYVLEGSKNNYLTNVEGSKEWADYVVEADVTLYDNGEVPQYTAIAARTKNLNKEGYEFRLIKQDDGHTVVRLYKRGIDSGKINDKVNKINVSVIPNEKHNMKMVVEGATIICYFDGVKMFEVTDKNEPYLTGYAGVNSADGDADSSFEYFAVRQIGAEDVVKDAVINKQDGDILFFDNFMGEESMTERGWSTDKVAIRNGAALVTTRVVADKLQGADKWTDYEVSAIVYVDKEAGIHGTATSGATAIVARSLSATSGYEFGILTSGTSTSYLRLLDRKTGLNIGEDKTTKITEGEHELRMVCIGKEIYCYFDGSLVIATQSNSWAAGYAGMRAANVDSYYKNFTVRKARPVTTTILPSGTVSPATGDNSMNVAVIYVAACIMSLSMIGFVVTTAYSRKRR